MSDPTPEERIAAIQARREATRAEHEAAFNAQFADDLEALASLEESLGFDRVQRINIGGWKSGEGAATMVVVRLPNAKELSYKRFRDLVSRSKDNTDEATKAGDMLADDCIVYPAKDTPLLKATLNLAAGIKGYVALQIVLAVRGKAEKEKKD